MAWGLQRFQQTGHSHFLSFSCYHRKPLLETDSAKRVFESALERVRCSFSLCVYAYVAMPERVHLLVSEPGLGTLAEALKLLKQGVSHRLIGDAEPFWQKRYYDFNVRRYRQFAENRLYPQQPGKARTCVRVRKTGREVVTRLGGGHEGRVEIECHGQQTHASAPPVT